MRTRRQQSSSDPMLSQGEGHRTVLLHESVQWLAIEPDDIVVDATLGGAGHSREIAKKLGPQGVLVGIDADQAAIARANEALKHAEANIILEKGNFRNIASYLGKNGIPRINKALFDLGWSGYQLSAGRGFSFLKDEPLLMTYSDDPDALTARTIVNDWGEESLADVIYGWGEERFARRIARRIVEEREKASIETSTQLAKVVADAYPIIARRGRLHPATKTFQAIRIAVNDEMGALKEGLEAAWSHMAPGGRIAVISFHSVEDREVKRVIQRWEEQKTGKRLVKSVITPSGEEIAQNPRARSAKLRVVQKL